MLLKFGNICEVSLNVSSQRVFVECGLISASHSAQPKNHRKVHDPVNIGKKQTELSAAVVYYQLWQII